jgi:1,4-alpha-glucan branching enzyme
MLYKTLELVMKKTRDKKVINTFTAAIERIRELEDKAEQRHALIWTFVEERKLLFQNEEYGKMKEVNKKIIQLTSKSLSDYKLLLTLYKHVRSELEYYQILERRLKDVSKQ